MSDDDDETKLQKLAGDIIAWELSDDRQIMALALEDGDVPLAFEAVGAEEIHRILKEEHGFVGDYNKTFERRLKDLADQVVDSADRARDDEEAYNQFIRNHPTPTHDHRGYPRWEGSEAQRLMKEDMANGTNKNMAPMAFYHSRSVYEEHCDLAMFRGHIDQEIRLKYYENWVKLNEEEKEAKRQKKKTTAMKKAKTKLAKQKAEALAAEKKAEEKYAKRFAS